MRAAADMLKAMHACEIREAAQDKAEAVIEKLTAMRLKEAAQRIHDGIAETLTYYSFPASHWRRMRTNNPLEPYHASEPAAYLSCRGFTRCYE